MIKLLLIICLLQTKPIYICTGSWASAYHNNKECKGLQKCTKQIVEIKLEDAQKMRKACGWCYKKN